MFSKDLYMADFISSYELVSRWENIQTKNGLIVYSKTESDKGGETVCGISRKAHPKMPLWIYIDEIKQKGVASPLEISKEVLENKALMNEIKYFYKIEYWNKIHGDEIECQAFADNLMLLAVNAGIKRAVVTGQRACGITDDGVYGVKTLQAFRGAGDKETKKFTEIEIEFYKSIVSRDRTQERFLQGWINRANAV